MIFGDRNCLHPMLGIVDACLELRNKQIREGKSGRGERI
jgi:hypothetical protein